MQAKRSPASLSRDSWRWIAPILIAGLPLLAVGAPQEELPSPPDAAAVGDQPVGDYEIGVEDRLRIHVWEDPDLKAGVELIVRPDGFISFPLVGEVMAGGATPSGLEAEIVRRIAPYIPEATVTVIIDAVNSFQFYVLGEVNVQGRFQVGSRLRVVHALALAGGLTPFAKKDQIVLVREEGGREIRYGLEYRKILAGDPGHNLWLRAGDTLIVN